MNTNNKRYTSCNTLLKVILLFALAGVLPAVQATPFTPPELEGFNLQDKRDADGDGDGKNETSLGQYLNSVLPATGVSGHGVSIRTTVTPDRRTM
jgi:hypothetical protein